MSNFRSQFALSGMLAMLLATVATAQPQAAPAAPTEKCAGLPPGKHANLERMTANFGLNCDQQVKIEVMLHAEESVSKPLLRYTSLSPDDQQGIMLKVKLAARRQIRTLLTPDQQKLMDEEIDQVAKTGKRSGKGGSKKDAQPAKADPLEDEESLSTAVLAYAAFSPAEKREIVLQVKRAARADSNLTLSAEQQKKLDVEILELSKDTH